MNIENNLMELTDRIYDKLMDNTQHKQYKPDGKTNAIIDARRGHIKLVFRGKQYSIIVKEVQP